MRLSVEAFLAGVDGGSHQSTVEVDTLQFVGGRLRAGRHGFAAGGSLHRIQQPFRTVSKCQMVSRTMPTSMPKLLDSM